jgi:hypothetical protein
LEDKTLIKAGIPGAFFSAIVKKISAIGLNLGKHIINQLK